MYRKILIMSHIVIIIKNYSFPLLLILRIDVFKKSAVD